jgi:hypothetical protein
VNLDEELRDILREHEPDLVAFARKAYEHGYQQGLAARPPAATAVESAPPAHEPVPAPGPPAQGPLFGEAEELAAADPDEPEEEAEEDDDGARPVRSSITVGGLIKKIKRHFGLARFDIELRVVDPRSHRHLMRGVRLSRYVLEGK